MVLIFAFGINKNIFVKMPTLAQLLKDQKRPMNLSAAALGFINKMENILIATMILLINNVKYFKHLKIH